MNQDKILELNRKYMKLQSENEKMRRLLDLISIHIPHLVFTKEEESIIYFTKIGNIFYLNNCKEDICMVCGKAKKTTAHHLIPLRANCKNKILKELRIRICEDCDKIIHPENAFLRTDKMLQNKDKQIKELRAKLK